MDDEILLVDNDDKIIGKLDKLSSHLGRGVLHRAFSAFIFNDRGELLIQQRSKNKMLWPMYWSNSCCSHPRTDDSYEIAGKKRVYEELGIECTIEFIYKFKYKAKYLNVGSENELCAVLLGRSNDLPKINDYEINDWKYIHMDELLNDIKINNKIYTPWFKLELKELKKHYPEKISEYTSKLINNYIF